MQWLQCPLVDADHAPMPEVAACDVKGDGVAEAEPSSFDLLSAREGHCAALLQLPLSTDVRHENASRIKDCVMEREAWVLVCGGYSNGELTGVPMIAATSTLPALHWRPLPYHPILECDGASLTTVMSHTMPPFSSSFAGLTAYMFGGLDAELERRSDLYAISLEAGADPAGVPTAVRVETIHATGEPPTARCRHGAGASNGCLYIFGGETEEAEQTNDFFVCCIATGVWRRLASPLLSASFPSPRLLCLSLVFVAADRVVLYGGAHFVGGVVQSFGDVWWFDVVREQWHRIETPPGWPGSNGHIGAAVRRMDGDGKPTTTAVFVGGKDTFEGCNALRLVNYDETSHHFELSMTTPTAGPSGQGPHWRYMPAAVMTSMGLLLLAGQCRHPQRPSSFLLSFARQ